MVIGIRPMRIALPDTNEQDVRDILQVLVGEIGDVIMRGADIFPTKVAGHRLIPAE